MEEQLDFICAEPSSLRIQFFFLLGIGIALGAIIFAVARYPQFRRVEYRGPPRPILGLIGAVFSVGIFLWLAITRYSTDFYRFELQGDRIRLHYVLPKSVSELRVDDLAEVRTFRRFRQGRGLVLETRKKALFTGIPGRCSREQIDAIQALIRDRNPAP